MQWENVHQARRDAMSSELVHSFARSFVPLAARRVFNRSQFDNDKNSIPSEKVCSVSVAYRFPDL